MRLTEVIKSDVSNVRAWLDAQQAPPTVPELVLAAYRAPSKEVRELLVAQARKDAGACDTCRLDLPHIAALVGRHELVVEAHTRGAPLHVPLELGCAPPVSGWAPLHIAAGLGHVEVVRELLDRGVPIDDGVRVSSIMTLYSALDIAVEEHREAVVALLLARGAKPGPRTVVCLTPSTPERIVRQLADAGLDLNEWPPGYPVTFTIGNPTHHASPLGRGELLSPADRVTYLQRLLAAGLRMDDRRLLDLLEHLRDPDAAEALIDCTLREGNVQLSPEGGRALFDFGMRSLPLGAVQRLVQAGVDPVQLRVKQAWLDADAKRTWLQGVLGAPPAPTFVEFAELSDDLLTTDVITAALAEGRILDLGVGSSSADAATAAGEAWNDWGVGLGSSSEDRATRAWHRLEVAANAAQSVVTQLRYTVSFGDYARAEALREALRVAFTSRFGKPRGRSKMTWHTARADLMLRSREGYDDGDVHCVVLEMEPPTKPEKVDATKSKRQRLDAEALAVKIKDYVNALSGDCFDVGLEAKSASVTAEAKGIHIEVGVAFTAHHGEDVEEEATLSWKDPPLEDDGLHPDLGMAIIEAIGAMVSEANLD